MPQLAAHPTRTELESFALGCLDNDILSAVEGHVGTCDSCRSVVAGVPADRFVSLLRTAQSWSDTPQNSADSQQTLIAVGAAAGIGRGDSEPSSRTAGLLACPAALRSHARYLPVRLLGQGGMGSVWLAEHRVMGRRVAVKVIRPEFVAKPGAAERFRRETHTAAMLAHPNIVTAFDAEQVGDTPLLAMEYVDGVSLAEELRRRGPLPIAEACDAVRQAALGLQHAHERGLVHRDVKPQNLMLTPEGVVKVLDFGLAVLADTSRGAASLTDGTVIMGTPDYIAPEQAEDARAADVRSDIYSLGCTLYHLLTGRVPFPDGSVLRKLDAQRQKEPEALRKLRPDVSAELAGVVARMMAKKPAERFQTSAEVATALSAVGQGQRPAPRRRWLVAAVVLFLGAVVAAGTVYRIQTDKGEVVIDVTSPDVEIVLLKGGKEVAIIDTKTNKRVTVPTGNYDVKVKNKPDDIEVKTDRIVVSRGQEVLVRIERVKPPRSVVGATVGEKVGEARRIPWEGGGQIWNTAISSDNRYYLAAGHLDTARVWDLKTGQLVHQFPAGIAYFTPDGHHLLTGSKPDSQFRLYDLDTGKMMRTFGGAGELWNFRISPDGKYVASISGSRSIHLWDLATGKELHKFTGKTAKLRFLFSTDSKRFVYSLDGKPAQALDLKTGQQVRTYKNILDKPGLYRFLSEGRVVMGYRNTTVLQFSNVNTGRLLSEVDLGNAAEFGPESVSPDGRRVLAGYPDGTYRLWDVASGQLLHRFTMIDGKHPHPAFLSPDGRYASAGSDDGSVYLWRLPESVPTQVGEVFRKRVEDSRFTSGVDLSPDGRLLLSMHWGELRVWDVASGKVVHQWPGWLGQFTLDGKQIVRTTPPDEEGNCLCLHDTASGTLLHKFGKHVQGFECLYMCPDGRTVVASAADGIGWVWDFTTGKLVKSGTGLELLGEHWGSEAIPQFQKRTGVVVAYRLPGEREVLGRDLVEGQPAIYELSSGRLVRKIPFQKPNRGEFLETAARYGRRFGQRMPFSFADGTICVMDLVRGQEVAHFSAGNFQPKCLAISADGRYLAACASNERSDVVVWRLPDPLEAHDKP